MPAELADLLVFFKLYSKRNPFGVLLNPCKANPFVKLNSADVFLANSQMHAGNLPRPQL